MNIVLIGYRGTGKSAISRILTDTLHCRRYSIDDEVVRQAGKPIPEIVEQEGWSKFREIERELVRKISAEIRSSVIDCGGGVVLDERNVADLKRDGKVILLVASPEKILERIHRDANRPPLIEGLSFEEEQRQILKERDPKYRAAADCIFDTTHLKPRQTAMKIIEHFKKKGWV